MNEWQKAFLEGALKTRAEHVSETGEMSNRVQKMAEALDNQNDEAWLTREFWEFYA